VKKPFISISKLETLKKLKRKAKKHGMILATYTPQVPLYLLRENLKNCIRIPNK